MCCCIYIDYWLTIGKQDSEDSLIAPIPEFFRRTKATYVFANMKVGLMMSLIFKLWHLILCCKAEGNMTCLTLIRKLHSEVNSLETSIQEFKL